MEIRVAMVAIGLLALGGPAGVSADDNSLVCNDVGELMYGDQQKCQKGDIIIVNPMMAAFLCDMGLPSISGEKTVVCHYLGKKRPERPATKK